MIQCTKEYMKKEKYVTELINVAKKKLKHRQMLYNRYTRKVQESDLKIPLEFYIANIAAGYFGGKAPVYSIKQETSDDKKKKIKDLFNKNVGTNADPEEFQLMIDYIRDYNDDSTFHYDLVKDYLITGACYGILYETNENEIVYSTFLSTQTVALYDYSTPVNKIGLMRIWVETDEDGNEYDMVEIIMDDEKIYYKNSHKQPKEYKYCEDQTEEVNWKLVPGLAIENPDELSIFEPVLDLIDSFEDIIRNTRNLFEYNDEAKLKITGFIPEERPMIKNEKGETIKNPEYQKEISIIKDSDIFFTPDKDGDIEWVIKNINDTASENHKKTLIDLILMCVCVPNVTDTGFTNADNASALEKKFFPLEQIIINADKLFKKEYLAMWENIVDRINVKKSRNFDFREIAIDLPRNMPTEKSDMVSLALQLRGLLSDETIIGLLPFDLDVQSELAKMKEQNETNMIDNFNNMVEVGKDKKEIDEDKDNLKEKEEKVEEKEELLPDNKETE